MLGCFTPYLFFAPLSVLSAALIASTSPLPGTNQHPGWRTNTNVCQERISK